MTNNHIKDNKVKNNNKNEDNIDEKINLNEIIGNPTPDEYLKEHSDLPKPKTINLNE